MNVNLASPSPRQIDRALDLFERFIAAVEHRNRIDAAGAADKPRKAACGCSACRANDDRKRRQRLGKSA